jgi:hypothetical protein
MPIFPNWPKTVTGLRELEVDRLIVTEDAEFMGDVDIHGDVTIEGDIHLEGSIVLPENADVLGDLHVFGKATVEKEIFLGGAAVDGRSHLATLPTSLGLDISVEQNQDLRLLVGSGETAIWMDEQGIDIFGNETVNITAPDLTLTSNRLKLISPNESVVIDGPQIFLGSEITSNMRIMGNTTQIDALDFMNIYTDVMRIGLPTYDTTFIGTFSIELALNTQHNLRLISLETINFNAGISLESQAPTITSGDLVTTNIQTIAARQLNLQASEKISIQAPLIELLGVLDFTEDVLIEKSLTVQGLTDVQDLTVHKKLIVEGESNLQQKLTLGSKPVKGLLEGEDGLDVFVSFFDSIMIGVKAEEVTDLVPVTSLALSNVSATIKAPSSITLGGLVPISGIPLTNQISIQGRLVNITGTTSVTVDGGITNLFPNTSVLIGKINTTPTSRTDTIRLTARTIALDAYDGMNIKTPDTTIQGNLVILQAPTEGSVNYLEVRGRAYITKELVLGGDTDDGRAKIGTHDIAQGLDILSDPGKTIKIVAGVTSTAPGFIEIAETKITIQSSQIDSGNETTLENNMDGQQIFLTAHGINGKITFTAPQIDSGNETTLENNMDGQQIYLTGTTKITFTAPQIDSGNTSTLENNIDGQQIYLTAHGITGRITFTAPQIDSGDTSTVENNMDGQSIYLTGTSLIELAAPTINIGKSSTTDLNLTATNIVINGTLNFNEAVVFRKTVEILGITTMRDDLQVMGKTSTSIISPLMNLGNNTTNTLNIAGIDILIRGTSTLTLDGPNIRITGFMTFVEDTFFEKNVDISGTTTMRDNLTLTSNLGTTSISAPAINLTANSAAASSINLSTTAPTNSINLKGAGANSHILLETDSAAGSIELKTLGASGNIRLDATAAQGGILLNTTALAGNIGLTATGASGGINLSSGGGVGAISLNATAVGSGAIAINSAGGSGAIALTSSGASGVIGITAQGGSGAIALNTTAGAGNISLTSSGLEGAILLSTTAGSGTITLNSIAPQGAILLHCVGAAGGIVLSTEGAGVGNIVLNALGGIADIVLNAIGGGTGIILHTFGGASFLNFNTEGFLANITTTVLGGQSGIITSAAGLGSHITMQANAVDTSINLVAEGQSARIHIKAGGTFAGNIWIESFAAAVFGGGNLNLDGEWVNCGGYEFSMNPIISEGVRNTILRLGDIGYVACYGYLDSFGYGGATGGPKFNGGVSTLGGASIAMRLYAGEIHNQKQLYFSTTTNSGGTDTAPYWKMGMADTGTIVGKKTFIVYLESDTGTETGVYLQINPTEGTTIRNQLILKPQTPGLTGITFKVPDPLPASYIFYYPSSPGSPGDILVNQGQGNPMIWVTPGGGGGGGGIGTVTSVAMTVPQFLLVSGSPITSSGTLAVTLNPAFPLPVANGGTGTNTATGTGSVVLSKNPVFTDRIFVNSLANQIVLSPTIANGRTSIGFYAGLNGTGTNWSVGTNENSYDDTFFIYSNTFGGAVLTISPSGVVTIPGGLAGTNYFANIIHANYSGSTTTGQIRVSPGTNNTEASISFYQNVNETGSLWTIGSGTNGIGGSHFGLYSSVLAKNVMRVLATGGIYFDEDVYTRTVNVNYNGTSSSLQIKVSPAGLGQESTIGFYRGPNNTSTYWSVGHQGGDHNFAIYSSESGQTKFASTPTGPATFPSGSSTVSFIDITGSTSGTVSIRAAAAAGTYNFNLPITVGASGQVLTSTAGGAMTWTTPAVAGGGTVTSIGMVVPNTFLSVSPTTITTNGTFTITFAAPLPVANGGTGTTTSTGTGSVVLNNAPILVGNLTTGRILASADIGPSAVVHGYQFFNTNATGGIYVNGFHFPNVPVGSDLYMTTGTGLSSSTATLIGNHRRATTALSYGSFSIYGGPQLTIDLAGQVKVLSTIASTSTTTGSFLVGGGAGIAGNLYVGGTITSTSGSSNIFSGKLYVRAAPNQINVSPSIDNTESSIAFYQNTSEGGGSWIVGQNVYTSGANVFAIGSTSGGRSIVRCYSNGDTHLHKLYVNYFSSTPYQQIMVSPQTNGGECSTAYWNSTGASGSFWNVGTQIASIGADTFCLYSSTLGRNALYITGAGVANFTTSMQVRGQLKVNIGGNTDYDQIVVSASANGGNTAPVIKYSELPNDTGRYWSVGGDFRTGPKFTWYYSATSTQVAYIDGPLGSINASGGFSYNGGPRFGYGEGSFDATIRCVGAAITIQSQEGYYTKTGKTVTVAFKTVFNITGSAVGNPLEMTLPFQAYLPGSGILHSSESRYVAGVQFPICTHVLRDQSIMRFSASNSTSNLTASPGLNSIFSGSFTYLCNIST